MKAIDTGNAPDNFKQALADYVRGAEDTIAAIKANDRTKAIASDAATNAAHARLVAIAEKY